MELRSLNKEERDLILMELKKILWEALIPSEYIKSLFQEELRDGLIGNIMQNIQKKNKKKSEKLKKKGLKADKILLCPRNKFLILKMKIQVRREQILLSKIILMFVQTRKSLITRLIFRKERIKKKET